MARYFKEPFPARAAIGVAALPLGVPVEVDAILVLNAPQEQTH
jgi:enamine deaminase RidA (YjgF/YER057c/UK114 family)